GSVWTNGVKDKDRRPGKKAGPATSSRGVQGRAVQPAASRLKPAKAHPASHGNSRPPAARLSEKPASKSPAQEAVAPRELRMRSGDKPGERIPVILETRGARDYHLIDSGDGLKLEQYGPYRIVRPEAQALWPKSL